MMTFDIPIVNVSMYSGRTQREKDRLAETITEDVAKILNIDKKEVIIVFQKHLMEIGMFLVSVSNTE
jgi:4-oxalocrotonate tautomerase